MSPSEPVVAEAVEPVVEAVLAAPEPVEVAPIIVATEVQPTVVVGTPVEWLGFFGLLRHTWFAIRSACEWLFGVASLTVGLAVLSAIPLVQFLTLGYLLEASGRIGRSGRLRDGFIGVRKAAQIGSIALGVWLMLLPIRFVMNVWESAEILDPGGPVATAWKMAVIALSATILLHIVAACSRGGKQRHFFWPFTNPIWLARRLARGGYYTAARDAVWDFVMSLRLPYYFWLGVRGFAGAFLWLVVPITLIALGRAFPPLGFFGALQLMAVVLFVPFVQTRFAVERRFRAFFEVPSICVHFWRAPWAFAFAFFITLLFALPLYLLKIEMIPRETAWLPSLVFLGFIFPARLLTGWAYGRSQRRRQGRHWFFGATGFLFMLPVTAFYVIVVYFTQFTGWNGIWSLYEQHAFLLPVPFMGM
jgi:hypothetical protein